MRLDERSLELDHEKTVNEILGFIRKTVENASTYGVVLGLSGGIDSTLTAALCCRALGGKKVLGVLMPAEFTPKEDVADALELAKTLGMRTERVDIDGICEAFIEALKAREDSSKMRMPLANVRARIRMIILYYFANASNCLVAGTSDRSEYLIGYFTKYGDGGADFFPIRHLYKTQARELARYLGIPERMASKPSSPQLYPGHRLSDEVPLDYDRLDRVLVGLFDYRLPPKKVSEMTDIALHTVMEVADRCRRTEHKRKSAPVIESELCKQIDTP